MTWISSARRFLLPLVPLYRLALAVREMQLGSSLEPVRRLHLPVVSIGGLSAGGSGKTPLTIALAQALVRREMHVDVLSRGYGRKSSSALLVDPDGEAREFGDEPLLMARNAGVPVHVAAQRYEAGLMAERAESSALGLHLLDDGFQHRQLHRDVDILLLDGNDLKDHLLPAGNLREPISAFERATILAIPADDLEVYKYLTEAIRIDRNTERRRWMGPIWRLHRRMDVPPIDGPVVAFCGIARSDQFFAGLEAAGLHLASRIAFADHHHYQVHDLDCIRDAARSIGATTVITTEKDRVRLGRLDNSLPLRTAGLRTEIENETEAVDELLSRLRF